MTDRLTIDTHFHGHDGALLLAGYVFVEITLATALVFPRLAKPL